MAYPLNLRFLVGKIESAAGTMETITSNDFDVRIRNPEVSFNFEIDDEASKFANGNHGEDEVVVGAQSGQITFSVRMAWGGTVTTEPDWFKFANACGAYKVTYTTTGLALQPKKTYDEKTMTIWVYDVARGTTADAMVYKFAGCMGNCVIGCEGIGKPWIATFTFNGKLEVIERLAAASVPAANNLDSSGACPDKFLSNVVTIDSVPQKVSSFQLDFGNEIQPVIDQSDDTGYSHYGITSRKPRFSTNPLLLDQNTDDVYWREMAGLTGCPDTYAVSVDSNHFYLKVLKAQLMNPALNNREGLVGWDQSYKCLGNGVTGALADTDCDPEVTWELLIGSRT